MAVHLFGAIDIGSYLLELKIFEISKKNGIRQVDDIMHRVDLGTDTYRTGKLTREHLAQTRKILREFRQIMDNYGIEDYRAYATSAFREMVNSSIVLLQLEQETGIHVEILSNSEQRFLNYKSIAFKGADFERLLENGTAIVDVGGGSIQISLFEKDRLVATQNMRIGILRLYEQLQRISPASSKTTEVIEELVNSQLKIFQKLYLKNREIRNIIVVDDYISEVVSRNDIHTIFNMEPQIPFETKNPGEFVDAASLESLLDQIFKGNRNESARALHIAEENVVETGISSIMLACIVKIMNAKLIWIPGVTLCDGIGYEFAQDRRILTIEHDFEQDIIACAKEISKRYKGSEERSKTLTTIALKIFDSTKRIHGMGDREKLLLQIAATLHDCGKYISMTNLSSCSYDIIMSTEIIGISHNEREIIASAVKFNHSEFVYYKDQKTNSDLSAEEYMTLTRLTAILRLANGLDRSHKKKFADIRIRNKGAELNITVTTRKDISVEKGLFEERAAFFEEVFGIRPVIKQKWIS